MGVGDDIQATAHARRLFEQCGRRVRIVDRNDQPRWNDVWLNNPVIARLDESGHFVLHRNGGHCRPYITALDRTRYTFRPGTLPGPGEIHFDANEQHRAASRRDRWQTYVVLEPNLKPKASPNKDWGWARYQALVRMCPAIRFVQIGAGGTRIIDGAAYVETPTFREGLSVLACAAAYVGAEGGLHHAAAALGIPAVVIFGGFIAPSVTGYDRPRGAQHTNLFVESTEHPHGCGWRRPCDHCRDAMARIEPERAAHALNDILAAGHAASDAKGD